jgi:hypothetical protein
VRERFKVDRIDRDAFDATVMCARLTVDTERACAPVLSLVQALERAQRRDDLTKQITDAENKQQEGAPAAAGNQESTTTIASADPLVEVVPKIMRRITRGKIEPSADDVVMLRIFWFTVPTVLAGVFLMLAIALWAPPRTKSRSPLRRLLLRALRVVEDPQGNRYRTTNHIGESPCRSS